MSHTPPPDDPTEILKALLRKLEKHIDASIEISDPDAHKELHKSLSIITELSDEVNSNPDISIIEGGLSGAAESVEEELGSAPPKLAIHSKIDSPKNNKSSENKPEKSGINFGDGSHFSVHFLSSPDELPFMSGQSVEQGKITLSGQGATQTILFGKSERHVRVHCQEGTFEVGSSDGVVAQISEGQSIDVESNCVYVSGDAPATGHYAIIDALGLEW